MSGKLIPSAKSVAIRCYGQGLGDCFLLAFPTDKPESPFYLAIDCGVVLGTPDASQRMTQVVQNIHTATDGKIDLLVVTHEHWDHVSGFVQAQSEWEKITIAQVWFAWTEDPKNDLAKRLKAEFEGSVEALRVAASQSQQVGIQGLAEFYGDLAVGPLAAAGGNTTSAAMQYVGNKTPLPQYCVPGEKHAVGTTGVVAHVLGPPQDEKALKKMDPGKEGYRELTALAAAVTQFNLTRSSSPFAEAYGISPEDAKAEPFFTDHYGFSPDDEGAWRRMAIDEATVGELALQLDSYTNNTSLVLAFELAPGGKVLLFVGDAQAGNWLSWDEGMATDLLARTIFYKVGHHGSHNATLKAKGIDRMGKTGEEFLSYVPVSVPVAHDIKGWKKMPLRGILDALQAKGSVVLPEGKNLPANVTASSEKFDPKEYKGAPLEEAVPLYLDILLPLS